MVVKFKRPKDLEYPKTYHTFHAKDSNTDELVEYVVEDLTEEYTEQALEIFNSFLSPEEICNRAAKVPQTPNAVKALTEFNRLVIKEKFSLACFKKETREFVGFNFLTVKSKSDNAKFEVRAS